MYRLMIILISPYYKFLIGIQIWYQFLKKKVKEITFISIYDCNKHFKTTNEWLYKWMHES